MPAEGVILLDWRYLAAGVSCERYRKSGVKSLGYRHKGFIF